MKYLIFLAAMLFEGRSPSAVADAVFSYNLNGVKVSGGEVDAVQANNTAWVTENGKFKKVQFFLSDGYSEKAEIFAHSLRFAIPAKIGVVTVRPEDDNWSVQLFVGSGDKYEMYGNDIFTVTVINISSTRVSGTFSGKEKPLAGTGGMLTVAEGKFDIPLRTEGH